VGNATTDIDELARGRVRLGLWIAVSFFAVLLFIAGNDALVQAGKAQSMLRSVVLLCLAISGVVMLASLSRFLALTRRSRRDPALKSRLWDELASTNHMQSMVFAYLAVLTVSCVLAVTSIFVTLSAPWVINGVLITAFAVQALSFAVLERRGADAGN
jgi:hypothetical protein